MFEAKTMSYIYVETPLHAGSGRSLGNVDLPIQRERVTGYPMVQSSSLKGCLRAESKAKEMPEIEVVFGPGTDNADKHAGALSPGDAKILLFPVRSLAGIFAWTTSVEVLNRFRRDATMTDVEPGWATLEAPEEGKALTGENTVIKASDKIVLEEFTFTPKTSQAVSEIGQWLAENALPQTKEYAYWQQELPRRLVILPNDDFRDFVTLSTEVVTRIKLDPDTKTVDEGPWSEEYLPTDTLLYAPLMSTPSRNPDNADMNGQEILDAVKDLELTRIQLGGNETVGRGSIYLRIA